MPHQCTNCGRTFDDGSKEMLSGCPDCGGNKFQFAPTTAAAAESFDGDATAGSAESVTGVESAGVADSADGPGATDSSTESDSVTTRAAETVRDWMPGRSSDASDSAESSPGADAGPGVRSSSDTPSESPPDTSSESPPATPPESPPGDSDTSSESDNPWPSSGRADTTEPDASAEGEFADWPETARRPEDRPGDSSEPTDEESVDVEHSPDRSAGPATTPDGPATTPDGPTTTINDDENTAQADARSEVVRPDDLPAHSDGFDPVETERDAAGGGRVDSSTNGPDDAPPEHGRVVSEPSGDRPSIEDLREELNEQFESIKIVRPGQYELNLMELYNRDEYIISLQEDGRYVIDVPDSWREGDDSDD